MTNCPKFPCKLDSAKLSLSNAGIEVDEEVVLMTTKGEAIAVGIAQVTGFCAHC